jgi:antitoxin (DNA-binding transcriptional repressor) of toxin-antitoxin stability system
MTIEISELAGRYREVLAMLEAGHEVAVTDSGVCKGKLVPVQPPPPSTGQRVFNMHPGAFWMAPDFDDPLPDEFWFGGDP